MSCRFYISLVLPAYYIFKLLIITDYLGGPFLFFLTKKLNKNEIRQTRASPQSLAIVLFGSKPFSGSYLYSPFIKLITLT